MSVDERLGIQLDIDLTTIRKQVQEAQKLIKDAFGNIDLSKITSSAKFSSSQINAIAKEVGKSAEDVKKSLKAVFDNAKLQDGVKAFKDYEKGLNSVTSATRKLEEEHAKTTLSILNNTKKSANEQLKVEEVKGRSIVAITKRYTDEQNELRKRALQVLSAQQEDVKRQVEPFTGILSGLNKQGLKYDNGLIIPKTYVTDINEARNQAVKFNDSLKTQADQILNINGKQVTLNKAIQEYSNWLTGLNKQGKGLWKDQIVPLSEYNKELGKASNSTKSMFGSLGQLVGLEARFYGVRAVLFGISNQVREAATAVLDLNQALHDTAAISGASVQEMLSLEKVALSIASSSKFTATEVMKTMEILAQAGVRPTDIPSTARAASMFATGAGATAQQSVDLLTTSLNAFGIEASRSMEVSNALTAALNSSKLGAGGLGTAFNYLANDAATMGMSLESALGIIAAVSQKGIAPSTIGTGMSQLITQLSAPKARFRSLLENKGVDLSKINPAKNEFSDVVKELEKADFTLEEIKSSLETRVARALITTLNVGSSGFKQMTDAVTGTSAALIANMKAMEGVRNQLNIIKQSFVSAINSIGKDLSGIGSVGLDAIKTLVAGLGTEGGRATVYSTVITGALAAISTGVILLVKEIVKSGSIITLLTTTFSRLNPWVTAVSVAFTLATGAVALFGRAQRKQKEELEVYTKAVASNADKMKQAEDAMLSFKLSIDATDEVKNKYTDLTFEQRKSLDELIKAFPQYLGNLDKERSIIEQINEALEVQLENKKIAARIGVSTYNYNNSLVQQTENKVASLESQVNRDPLAARYNSLQNDKVLKDLAKAKSDLELYKAYRQLGIDQAAGYGVIDKQTGIMSFADTVVRKPSGKVRSGETPPKGSKEQPVNFQELLRKIENENSDIIATYTVKDIENKIEILKDNLKELQGESPELYDAKVTEIQNNLEKLKSEKIKQFQLDFWGDLANNMDAVFNPADGPSGKLSFQGPNANTNMSNYLNNKDSILKLLQGRLSQFSKEQDSDLFSKVGNINGFKPKDPEASTLFLSADIIEKSENRRLATLRQTAELQKDLATTSDQVKKIEIDTLNAEIKSSEIKAKAFDTEIAEIELWVSKNTLTEKSKDEFEKYSQRHDQLIDKLENENSLQAVQLRTYKELANLDPWYNFKKGVSDAIKDFGTFSDNIRDFGKAITNQAAGGISEAINSSVNVLLPSYAEKEKIQEIRNELSDLQGQKSIAEQKIAEIQGRTIKTSGDVIEGQKLQQDLEKINKEISKQERLLDQQTNAWKKFQTALGSILNDLARSIQKFLIDQAVQGFFKFVAGMFGTPTAAVGATPGQISSTSFSVQPTQTSAGRYSLFAEGGPVASNLGIPGVDSVPSLLMPREYVVPVDSHEYYGTQFLDAIKNKQIRRFSDGGAVSKYLGGTSGNSGGNTTASLQIVNVLDVNSIPAKSDANQIINIISADLLNRGQTKKVLDIVLRG